MEDTNENKPNVATVTNRLATNDGRPIGQPHSNPLLHTRKCNILIPDDTIAENLWSHCDSEGCEFHVIIEVVDHRKKAYALTNDEGMETDGWTRKNTTKGWEILV